MVECKSIGRANEGALCLLGNNPVMFIYPTGMKVESIQTKYVNDRGDLLYETMMGVMLL